MPQEIGLQELIWQVKRELLAQSEDDPVPLFYIEGIDLELHVEVRVEGQASIKIYVVDVGGSGPQARGQVVRVSLRPLYSKEELREMLEQDPALGKRLQDAASQGVLKNAFEQ